MVFPIHIKVGAILYKNLVLKYDAKLAKLAFIIGNCYPDFNPRIRHNPHNMEDCIYEVEQFMGAKIKNKIRKSFRLGIVCHYATDSFCAAHLLPEVYNTRDKHLTYEIHRWRRMNKELSNISVESLMPVSGGLGQYREAVQACSQRGARDIAAEESENLIKYSIMIMSLLLSE